MSQGVEYSAIVVGAGPGGLAAVASLLDAQIASILWVDRTFQGGRLNEIYREISSNTKVGLYLDALESSSTCSKIIDAAPKPNAVTQLEQIDRDQTCQLALAGDVIKLLIDGMLVRNEVEQAVDEVEEARFDEQADTWTVKLDDGRTMTAKRVILATGSHPMPQDFHKRFNPSLKALDLDRCMIKSTLPELFRPSSEAVVAVIGNSHSGILVCRNLYELKEEGKVDLHVINFRRRPIKYAIYREDGIVNDNSGLKGATAEWAKEVMESLDTDVIRQIDLDNEERVYAEWLPKCTHIVYAIGYEPNPLPRLYLGQRRIEQEIDFDMHTSGFRLKGSDGDKTERGLVKGLFGCGIAFPEKVADPEGSIEAAVGVAKFFKFTERVKADWIKVR